MSTCVTPPFKTERRGTAGLLVSLDSRLIGLSFVTQPSLAVERLGKHTFSFYSFWTSREKEIGMWGESVCNR